jgi:hypothetical protein
MKTAVSIPDDVFEKGEKAAKRLKLSRSCTPREFLRNHTGRLPRSKIQAILRGVDTVLGR